MPVRRKLVHLYEIYMIKLKTYKDMATQEKDFMLEKNLT